MNMIVCIPSLKVASYSPPLQIEQLSTPNVMAKEGLLVLRQQQCIQPRRYLFCTPLPHLPLKATSSTITLQLQLEQSFGVDSFWLSLNKQVIGYY